MYLAKFNFDDLMLGDNPSLINSYSTARLYGWMSANDIRSLEQQDLIPDEEGGNLYLINGNMLPLKQAGAFYHNGEEETTDE